jgi:excisionase family DNA binding protein
MSGPLLSILAAASQVGVSVDTMRRQIASGDGPATIPVGRRRLIDRDDLLLWLDARRQATKSSAQSSEAA